MPNYTVEITEVNRFTIELHAESQEEAEKFAEEMLLEVGEDVFECDYAVARQIVAELAKETQ